MYTQIINIITEPLVFFYMFIAPIIGMYISYVAARALHKRSNDKDIRLGYLLPAFLLALLSSISIALSGLFAAGILGAQCLIGSRIECGSAGWLAFPYITLCVPIGIVLFVCALFIFRSKSSTPSISPPTRLWQKLIAAVYLLTFVLTFLIYLPTDQMAANLAAKDNESVEGEPIAKLNPETETMFLEGTTLVLPTGWSIQHTDGGTFVGALTTTFFDSAGRRVGVSKQPDQSLELVEVINEGLIRTDEGKEIQKTSFYYSDGVTVDRSRSAVSYRYSDGILLHTFELIVGGNYETEVDRMMRSTVFR